MLLTWINRLRLNISIVITLLAANRFGQIVNPIFLINTTGLILILFWIKITNLIFKNEETAKTFNGYFSAIVDNLNLHHWEDKTSLPSSTSDKTNDIIKNYEKHPSNCKIKAKYRGISSFSFRPVSVEEVKKIIRDL